MTTPLGRCVAIAALLAIVACDASEETASSAGDAEAKAQEASGTAASGPESGAPAAGASEATAAGDSNDPGPEGMLYARADLWKPDMSGAAPLDPYLAPLVYVNAPDEAPTTLASVVADASGRLKLDAGRPAIYYADEEVTFGETQLRQLSFIWFSGAAPNHGVRPQGLRMTLASNGFPWVFEFLDEGEDRQLVFVVDDAESAARAAYGEPLSGKEHSVEAAAVEGLPPVVVGHVLADGAAPMGPYVYVSPESASLDGLHCRCEPTRTGELREMFTYELRPLEHLIEILPSGSSLSIEFGAPDWAALFLRLPASF